MQLMRISRNCCLLAIVGLAMAQDQETPLDLRVLAGGGDKAALAQLRARAIKGDVDAQSNLAIIYLFGSGVPRDYVQAALWYRKAAEQGDAYSQASLGDMYSQGDGVPKDAKQAVHWYTKAAEQGNTSAQNSLALMYESGDVLPKDVVLAYMWRNLAAAHFNDAGGESAKAARDRLEKLMTPTQIAEGQKLSREWKPKTAFRSSH